MMNIEKLKNIITETNLDRSELNKTIYKVLLETRDSMTVKPISQEILNLNFESLENNEINKLIEALGGQVEKEDILVDKNKTINKKEEIDLQKIQEELKTLTELYNTTLSENQKLINSNKNMSKSIKDLENKLQKINDIDIDKIIEENIKLKKIALLTEKQNAIEVSDEDINNLYIEYVSNKENKYNEAFLVEYNNKIIIPKKYYEVESGRNGA